jgi:ubiquitin C
MLIFIKTLTNIITIEVSRTDTVENLKTKIEDKEGVKVEEQQLVFSGKKLENEKTLEEYNIEKESMIYLILHLTGPKKVIVKSLNDKKFELELRGSDRIKDVKIKIENIENIPLDQQCLMYNHKKLEDDKQVSEYNLENGSIINLVQILNGTLEITIKLIPNNTQINLNIGILENLKRLKSAIKEKVNIPLEQQRLVYNGMLLQDDEKLLQEYNIEQNSVINLVNSSAGNQDTATPGVKKVTIQFLMPGQNFILNIEDSETIQDVKVKIQNLKNIPHEKQCLIYKGIKLSNDKKVSECTIQNDSTINLVVLNIETFDIQIKLLNDETVTFQYAASVTIKEVKMKILEIKDIPIDKQNLIFGGVILDDTRSIEFYNLQQGSQLRLVLNHTITEELDIFIKKVDGGVFTLKIDSTKTIFELKTKINGQIGIPIEGLTLIFSQKILENSKKLSEYKITDGSVVIIFESKGEFSAQAGIFTSAFIDFSIPANALNTRTTFLVKESNENLKIPLNVLKITPIFRMEPFSLKFNVPIGMRFKNLEHNDTCLFILENEGNDKVLNKWTCCYSTKIEITTFEFKVASSGFFFLGRISLKTYNPLKAYQLVHSGLNYVVNCEDTACECNTQLTVIPSKQDFDKHQPNNDIDLGFLKCPICDETINDIESIKNIVLFQSEGNIDFKRNIENSKLQTVQFDLNDPKTIILFGDDEMRDAYTSLSIKVKTF